MYSLPLIETSRNCAKVSTSEERQSFVQNLDQVIYVYQIVFSSRPEVGWIGWKPCIFQAQIKNMQADKDIEKIAMGAPPCFSTWLAVIGMIIVVEYIVDYAI
ncbi:uncharacterized protein G2W53_026331 [Senna tora]|uniref:Uncharacterized protein n=1 Tax=Senna tora TaxID=362788 RepID=A0A834TGS9_9FABA|nr:uncharacterized protein G2W53_026331 [Senna tora]